jgi:hypothetical protein
LDDKGQLTSTFPELQPAWGQLAIGPNPSRDLLRIQLENDYQGEVAINAYTTEGRLIGNWKADKLSDQMTWETSLADLPAGSYWVQVKSSEGQVTAGWVKQ